MNYDPDATAPAGNYSFSYRAEFTQVNTASATFSLPISNASCGQNSAIDFSERTVGENWKAQTGVTIGNTTVSSRAYISSVPAGQTNILEISNQPTRLSTQGLVWQLNNQGFAGDNRSVVEMNFSRPVRNLAFSMEDIDISTMANGGSDFVDEVTFNAYALGSTTPYQLTAADVALGSNNSNSFGATANTIKGVTTNNGPAGTVVLTYPAGVAISRLEIIYRNTQTYTAANTRLQTVGIPSMVWCAEVDLATTLTGPTYSQAGRTVTYVATTKNQGDIAAASVQATVQLIPALSNVTINGAAAGTSYNAVSGLLTLPAIGTLNPAAVSTSTIAFTMPTLGSVTGQAKSTTTGLDVEPVNNNGTLANATVTTVQNQPPVASNVTTASMPSSNGATAISAFTATDPNGNGTVASYTISTLPPAGQGTLFVNGVAATAGQVLTPAQAAQLSFDPSGTSNGNVTFTYTATDDFGIPAATSATYTIPVANVPPVAQNITNAPAMQASNDQTAIQPLLATDADGTVTSFTLVSLPVAEQGQLFYFNGTTTVAATAGLSIPLANAGNLRFDPASTFVGNASFTYSATDNNNVAGNAATYAIPVVAPLSCQPSYLDNTTSSSGLTAEYYAGYFADNLGYFQRVAPLRRNDPAVNFSNGNGSATWGDLSAVATGSAADWNAYSSRYRGSIYITTAGSYTFYLNSDDASYLWLDGAALAPTTANASINNGGLHGVQERAVTLTLTAGLHDITVAYGESGGGNTLRLEYESTANNISRQVIPQGVLCAGPATTNNPPVANDATNQGLLNSTAATVLSPSLSATDPDGNATINYYNIVALPTAAQGVLAYSGTAVVAGQAIPTGSLNLLTFDPAAGFSGSASFTYSVTDNGGRTDLTPATYTIPVLATVTLSGTVFEDVNYGGGAGRPLSAAGTAGRPNATVELYDADGNYVASTTSNASGQYTFSGVGSGSYTVRVVNTTVSSSRNTNNALNLVPVQTFVRNGAVSDVNRVGGEASSLVDAAANPGAANFANRLTLAQLTTNTATPQSITSVTVAANPVPVSTIDFGFNFDVITNTNDAGQGSLRQFILNSNALPNTTLDQVAFNGTVASGTTAVDPAAGVETSIFMIGDGRTSNVPAGLRSGINGGFSGSTATITLLSNLPSITDANTALDGSKQTTVTGNNVAAVAGTTTGPEIIINYNSTKGLEVNGASTRIASVGFTNARGIGITAQGVAIFLNNSQNSTITNVTATGNNTGGIYLNNADGAQITSNVLLGNPAQNAGADGILVDNGTINATVTGNTIRNYSGAGIDLVGGINTGNTFSGNLISGNGSGITIGSGNDNLFSQNTISGNIGDGIVGRSGTSSNRFTRNSFSGNGDLGIDLSANTSATGDGTSLNDDTDADTGANGLLNFPVIMQVANDGTNLRFLGYAPAKSLVEFFVADVAGPGFGEGNTFLVARTEGLAGDDTDNGFGYYSGLISGVNQGREDNVSRFLFTIPLSSLTAPQLAALTATGARITATATILNTVNGLVVGNTSEFSGNTIVNAGPLPVELKAFEVHAAKANALLAWSTASEKNNDRFEIERSLNGTTFEKIGTVRGQGTSQAPTTYTFTDAGVGARAQGVVYYRLRQVDSDGTNSYSPVRTVRFEAQAALAAKLMVFPNPATTADQAVTLDLSVLPKGTYQATLLDVTGRLMGSYSVEGGINKVVDVQALPAGTYLVLVRGNGLSLSQRLIKE